MMSKKKKLSSYIVYMGLRRQMKQSVFLCLHIAMDISIM